MYYIDFPWFKQKQEKGKKTDFGASNNLQAK